jgi:hypothetical protein
LAVEDRNSDASLSNASSDDQAREFFRRKARLVRQDGDGVAERGIDAELGTESAAATEVLSESIVARPA